MFDTSIENHEEKVLCYTRKPLQEIKLTVGLEKTDSHEGTQAEALLDSGVTGLFINKSFAKQHGFRLSKLDHPIPVRNLDGTPNSEGLVTHEVEANIYFKGHVEKVH